jgi:quercetin dioxygenase-like cupin family protein/peptidoglycan/LPS O-acetylase OafA/YrhL
VGETPFVSGALAAPSRFSGRDRYLDLLRAIALIRVVAYHSFSSAVWLSMAFPSMGVMFALAGSLMARSLDRPALGVLRSRTRRLLLPLWAYSGTVLVLLLWQGWTPTVRVGGSWLQILLWFIPLGDPPFPQNIGSDAGLVESSWALQAEEGLWYIRTYFWFMLLSPLLLKAFQRLPWTTLLAPLGLMAVLSMGLIPLPDWGNSAITDFATYGSCWILGFAHNNGLLLNMPRRAVFAAGLALMAMGLTWASSHPDDAVWDLNNTPLAQALWSLGFCAMLLRISPSWKSLPRPIRYLDKPITLINNRALTIYLWHNLLLVINVMVIDRLYQIDDVAAAIPWVLSSEWTQFIGVWPLLAVLFLTIGWVEDVAAERAPRLWPTGSPKKPSALPGAADRNGSGRDLRSRPSDAQRLTAGSGLRTGPPRPEEPQAGSGRLTAKPLAREPGHFSAYKCTVPAGPDSTRPEPHTHNGNRWIYVLKGRLLLRIGDQDMVLAAGQSAEIGAGTPHWVGSAGTEPVEYLDIFGDHGIPARQPESEDSLSTPMRGPASRAGGHILG